MFLTIVTVNLCRKSVTYQRQSRGGNTILQWFDLTYGWIQKCVFAVLCCMPWFEHWWDILNYSIMKGLEHKTWSQRSLSTTSFQPHTDLILTSLGGHAVGSLIPLLTMFPDLDMTKLILLANHTTYLQTSTMTAPTLVILWDTLHVVSLWLQGYVVQRLTLKLQRLEKLFSERYQRFRPDATRRDQPSV